MTEFYATICLDRLVDRRLSRYNMTMNSVQEIVEAIRKLEPSEREALRAGFAGFDAEAWDRELDADVPAGRLDRLAQEALDDLRKGRCTDL